MRREGDEETKVNPSVLTFRATTMSFYDFELFSEPPKKEGLELWRKFFENRGCDFVHFCFLSQLEKHKENSLKSKVKKIKQWELLKFEAFLTFKKAASIIKWLHWLET